MSAEEKNTWLAYQLKPDEKLFVRTLRMDARLTALWLSTAYPEPLFPTGYARIAKMEELSRLRREKAELEKENSFLKKAAAFFAKEID